MKSGIICHRAIIGSPVFCVCALVREQSEYRDAVEYDFLRAVALLMIFEGVMPFLSPDGFKRNMLKMLQLSNQALRTFGLAMMLLGLGLLYWVSA